MTACPAVDPRSTPETGPLYCIRQREYSSPGVVHEHEHANSMGGSWRDGHHVISLVAWWAMASQADGSGAAAKMKEYGSRDLVVVGDALTDLANWEDAPDRVKAELGCAFYLHGKVARAMEAYAHHRLPSDDTLHDVTVYSMMMRRIRAVGGWQ